MPTQSRSIVNQGAATLVQATGIVIGRIPIAGCVVHVDCVITFNETKSILERERESVALASTAVA